MFLQAFPFATQANTDFVKMISTNELPVSRPAISPAQPVTAAAPSKPGPTLVKVKATLFFSPLNMISPLSFNLNAVRQYGKNISLFPPTTAKPAEAAL